MSTAPSIVEQMPMLHRFSPSQLIAYLYDWSQSHPKCVFDLVDIYLITQMLNEQVHRNLVNPKKKSDTLILRDKK